MYHTDRTTVPDPTQRLTPRTYNKVSSPLFFDLNKDLFQGVGKLYSKFIESNKIMKLTNQLQLQKHQSNCKNLTVINDYISYYQQYTRNTVENILKLSSMITEMKEKEKSGELDKTDMNYFCFSVGLKRKGSTFRKFEQIGKHSETFWKYVDKLPDSYTVLYEITTLDSDKFEELMGNNQITSYVTLKDIKQLGNKLSKNKQSKSMSSFKVLFNRHDLNKEKQELLGSIVKGLSYLNNEGVIQLLVPEKDSGIKTFAGKRFDFIKSQWVEEQDLTLNQSFTSKDLEKLEELIE